MNENKNGYVRESDFFYFSNAHWNIWSDDKTRFVKRLKIADSYRRFHDFIMAKQLNLLSFFGKRPNVAIINKKEQHIVRNILDDILRQVEKNVDADKISTRKRNANNNINDLIMTNEKIKIWKKEFTFWDTEDGKVIINSHLNFYSFINFFSHEECLEISCCFLFLFSLYKLKVGYLFFFTDFFFFLTFQTLFFLFALIFFFIFLVCSWSKNFVTWNKWRWAIFHMLDLQIISQNSEWKERCVQRL